MKVSRSGRRLVAVPFAALALFCGLARGLLGTCGPFTDVAGDSFCPLVLEIFFLGITTGTTATTYDPASNVNRLQMAAFLSRTVDRVLSRGARRAALDQFWTTQNATVLGVTTVGAAGADPILLKSDGADIWVANEGGGSVARVRASDGKLLETWTGATQPNGVLVAMGRVFVADFTVPARLYRIDPAQPAGVMTTVATNLGDSSIDITFDGARIWTANAGGSVSIVTPGATIPWTVTTVTAGFTGPVGAVFDGANVWIADRNAGKLWKLDAAGAILSSVTVGGDPEVPAFDGTSIWVPNFASSSVSVVRASTGAVLQTLTGNGLDGPFAAAFDGQRVMVTNNSGQSVSLWKAADLTPLGSVATGPGSFPEGVCSDGIHFWIALSGPEKLARF